MNVEYRRTCGEKRNYRVTVELTGHPGNFHYKASIYHGDELKGHAAPFDLTATDADSAMMEDLTA